MTFLDTVTESSHAVTVTSSRLGDVLAHGPGYYSSATVVSGVGSRSGEYPYAN